MYFRQNYPTSKLDDNDTGADPASNVTGWVDFSNIWWSHYGFATVRER